MKIFSGTNTIKGRVRLLIVTFLILLTITIAFVLSQNYNIQKLGKGVKDVTLPLALNGQEILIKLQEASTTQRAYAISREERFFEKRAKIWQEEILPALAILSNLKQNLENSENVARIERLEVLLLKYQKLQKQIDENLQKNNATYTQVYTLDTADILQDKLLVKALIDQKEQIREFSRLIEQKIDPIKVEIEEAIDPLLRSETEFLYSNIGNLNESVTQTSIILVCLTIIVIAISMLIAYFLFKQLKLSIARPTQLLNKLSKGKLSEKLKESSDELNAVIIAGNQLNHNLATASKFAEQIGEGNLNGDFQPVDKEDVLGNALVQMRNKLRDVSEADNKRSWTTTGLNEIGNILRQEHSNLVELGNSLLVHLIKYLKANQGILFIVNDDNEDDIFLEQLAMYAWDRVKYPKINSIRPGEELIGQVWQEKEITYLEEVPKNYIQISSGLGEANPRSLTILPLLSNNQVYGVIEIASFNKFEKHQLDFLNSVSETIASTLSNIKVNAKTKRLLEQTQEQAESMRAQEEELRQNLEELQATQEAMRLAKKEKRDEVH